MAACECNVIDCSQQSCPTRDDGHFTLFRPFDGVGCRKRRRYRGGGVGDRTYLKGIPKEGEYNLLEVDHHIRQFLLSFSSMAVSAASTSTTDCFAYYHVLPDMTVVKYFIDHVTTGLPSTSTFLPIWRQTIIGEYVYFPSEGKWIFVNSCTNEDASSQSSVRKMAGNSNWTVSPTSSTITKKDPPKLRYCAHQSHTPTTNFAQAIRREPIRDNWPTLISKLLAIKYDIDSNNYRRFRNGVKCR